MIVDLDKTAFLDNPEERSMESSSVKLNSVSLICSILIRGPFQGLDSRWAGMADGRVSDRGVWRSGRDLVVRRGTGGGRGGDG